MGWTNLKATISAVIKANNKQEITGTILNSIFNSVINYLGANASFAGIATPKTSLVVQDGPTFWIAGQAGTYNLGGTGVVVGHATLAIFTWDCSTWNYGLIPISGVITVDNLIEAVQEATEQIRADLDALREQLNENVLTSSDRVSGEELANFEV